MTTADAKFAERFPKYALLAPRWTARSQTPRDLSAWRAALDLEHVEVLYVFGLEPSAYTLLREWLHGHPERQLVFLERDEGVIAAAIQSDSAWLFDSQVDLEWLQSPEQLAELAERYPAKRIEATSCRRHTFQKERLTLLRKTMLSYSLFVDRLHGFQLFYNFVRNLPHLSGAFYVNRLAKTFQGVPAIVCGAGPSLQSAIEQLRALDGRALVIAGGSTLAALSAAGVEPHFGIAIDPNLEELHRFQKSFCFECPLIVSTRVFPGIFGTCSGPFGYVRAGIGGAPELWLDEELGLQEPLMGQHLSEESISVTSIALSFAQHLGCNPILLSGVDLAYTGGKRYAAGVIEESPKLRSRRACPNTADQILRRKDKQGKFVDTAVRWVMEAASISHFAKHHPEVRWINTTEGGLPIAGLEQMPLERAARELLTGWWDLRGRVAQEIAMNPLPPMPPSLLPTLRSSLERIIEHLEVLADVRRGSKALAELELRDEIAYSVLFYDMPKVLAAALARAMREPSPERERAKWALHLDIAKKHLELMP